MSHFPSRNQTYCGIIRMHDYKTCEISLLLRSNSSVWSQKTSMFGLQKNLVNPSKETRTTKDSDTSQRFKSDFPGKIYSRSFGQTPTRCGSCELPSPIPSRIASFCRTSKSPETAFGPINLVSRRTLVPLSKETLDLVFNGSQAMQGKNSLLSRSCSSFRQRKQNWMGSGIQGYSFSSQIPYSGFGRRQFKRHEENRQTRGLGASALSFSSDSKIPSSTPPAKTRLERRRYAGRNLSAHPSDLGNSQWIPTQGVDYKIRPISQKSSHNISNPSHGSGIPKVHKLLPCLPDSSGTESAIHNQHYRVDEQHYPGSATAKPFGFKPSSALAMGNSTDSATKEIKLQRQALSTDLIDPTPKWNSQMLAKILSF